MKEIAIWDNEVGDPAFWDVRREELDYLKKLTTRQAVKILEELLDSAEGLLDARACVSSLVKAP